MKKEKKLLPLGERAIIKVELKTIKPKDQPEYTDLSREAKVLEVGEGEFSNSIKKGSTVYYNPRGCINIDVEKTKTHVVLVVDSCDIYAQYE